MKAVSVIKIVEPTAMEPLNLAIDEHENCVHFARVFWPIYCFARMCGFMPFSIRRAEWQNGQFLPRIRWHDVVWYVISMCFYLAMIINTFCGKIILPHEANAQLTAIGVGNHLLRLMILSFSIFVLIIDVCNRHALVSILNEFTAFDQEVSQNPYSNKKFRNVRARIFVWICR